MNRQRNASLFVFPPTSTAKNIEFPQFFSQAFHSFRNHNSVWHTTLEHQCEEITSRFSATPVLVMYMMSEGSRKEKENERWSGIEEWRRRMMRRENLSSSLFLPSFYFYLKFEQKSITFCPGLPQTNFLSLSIEN